MGITRNTTQTHKYREEIGILSSRILNHKDREETDLGFQELCANVLNFNERTHELELNT